MSITRLGIILLLLGAVMLLSSLREISSRVGASYGTLMPNETSCVIILAAPLGRANLTIGEDRSEIVKGIQLHTKMVSPNGEVLMEVNLTTPYSFTANLDQRGAYRVYLTNQGDKESEVPLMIDFYGGFANIEGDRLFINEVLLSAGVAFVLIGMLSRIVRKRLARMA